jgi:hypothetical protein
MGAQIQSKQSDLGISLESGMHFQKNGVHVPIYTL